MTMPMTPTLCGLDELGDGIGRAATVLRANAGATSLATPVPTCPGWDVLDLVVHTGMVHRWAAASVVPPASAAGRVDPEEHERAGRGAADVLDWFDEGATALLQALADAPDDLETPVFLREAPPARLFWARRQCHETTIHAVDALAARLGRCPTPAETWIRPPLALDGIDELVRGFVPRRRQHVNPDHPVRVVVAPDDAEIAWRLDLHPEDPPVVERVAAGSESATDHVLGGGAVDLYLRLWSRSPAAPADEVEQWWRDSVSVRW